MKLKFGGLIEKGDRIAVALSGGKDSVALFHALCACAEERGIEVCAVNIEHGIRGAASVKDSEFVRKICNNAGKRLLSYKTDAPAYAREKGLSIESAARELRYKLFLQAIDAGFCDKVATAHHADDNAESVLLNIFRGSGLKGLCGIPETAYDGKIIRPMLSVGREEIDRYAEENGLEFVTDESNFDDAYSRNFLRNRVIPLIKEKYPDVENSLSRLSAICAEADEYIENCAKKAVKSKNGEAEILLGEECEKPLLSRAAIMAMKAAGLEKDYEAVHVDAVLSLARSQVGARVDLPHGFKAERRYDVIIIYKDRGAQNFCFPFGEGVFDLPGGVLTIEKTVLPEMCKNKKVAFFAKERAKGVLYISPDAAEGAVIRTRKTGDVFRRFGSGGKSLKEYLADEKTDRRGRDILPVCARGSEIVFVAGMAISSSAAVGDEREIYKIVYESKTED